MSDNNQAAPRRIKKVCPTCGNDDAEYLNPCPYCDALKCDHCDCGDDCSCLNCENSDEEAEWL